MSKETIAPALYGGPCPICGTHSTAPCLRTDCGRLNKQGDYPRSTSQTTEPWCILCGQCHAFGSQCDPERLAWLEECRVARQMLGTYEGRVELAPEKLNRKLSGKINR